MAVEIKVPTFPESVSEGTIAAWRKEPGDYCVRDELVVEIETDKVVLEVVAPESGTLLDQLKAAGGLVASEEVIAHFEVGEKGESVPAPDAASGDAAAASASAVAEASLSVEASGQVGVSFLLSPAARRLAEEHGVQPEALTGTGKGGRITKEDVLAFVRVRGSSPQPAMSQTADRPAADKGPSDEKPAVGKGTQEHSPAGSPSGERPEQRVPMTRLRAKVAERLLQAQQSAAMLTTFNEVNMRPIMEVRKRYRDLFEKRHGVKLGFMSFFVKAAVEALKRHPVANASIDGQDVVYHGYQDIGVAVSSERGLVVPVVRDAEQKTLAELETCVRDYGIKARDGKLAIEDMTGGTFTISNGGVFGSLLSTPILNPPQSAILGMHKIQERPVAVDGQVVILPMMYLALSYDHRLLDGKEAVTFLVTMKELLEDPTRILLAV
ncbi:MAG: 2-oxoglutarate dehydrogenase complex dihydrolipoyllysine-residue succinyltransferase [Kistimonas sp.]|nr:2-oxoglutarate dehydrogenase complex dihydrolipoyllysine-residue succinyltransferase [Kistimonas sp.]